MNAPQILGSATLALLALGSNALFAPMAHASVNSVTLEWDAVDDERVAYYEVHWGTESGQYDSSQKTEATEVQVGDLSVGETYYFAAKACAEEGTICSDFSEELTATIEAPALVPDFLQSGTTGNAPLIVLFRDNSEGDIEQYEWDFGDGGRSTAGIAMHRYSRAGTYTVSLTVKGPDGEATKTKTDLVTVTDYAPTLSGGSGNPGMLRDSGSADASAARMGEVAAGPDPEIAVGFGARPGGGGWNHILDSEGIEQSRFQLDWPEYNSLSGETRLAAGDIDGDGLQEVVVGLGSVADVPDMPQGAFRVYDDDLSPLTWGQVEWPEYNGLNGETRPALGDLDGDGIAEIVIGLGPGGGGLVQVFKYSDGEVVNAGWTRVDWPEYAESNGETRVAAGDVDADGIDELVMGFGRGNGAGATAGGNFLIKDEIAGFSRQPTLADPRPMLSSWDRFGALTWGDYATAIGETHPATGDIDGDGIAEIVLGLGEGGDGTIEVFDFEPDGYVLPLTSTFLSWPEYNAVSGEIRPAVADLNGDGFAEVIAGLGRGGEGRIELFENFSTELVHQASIMVGDDAYRVENGETWPTVIEATVPTDTR